MRNLNETHRFARKIGANLLHLEYELREANGRETAENWLDFLHIDADESVKTLAQNDFQIDLNKKMRLYGTKNQAGKIPVFLFVIIFFAVLAGAVFFAFREKNAAAAIGETQHAAVSEPPRFSAKE